MPSMLYSSMQMSIGWSGLSMPTEGCSVHMPIVIINFKVRGVKQESVPYMMQIILTHISVKCGIFKAKSNQNIGQLHHGKIWMAA